MITIRDRPIYIKHDSHLRLESGISGNKARKLLAISQLPISEFPKTVCSYGGAQSNAMLALAAECSHRGSRFVYYMKKLPRYLRQNPSGNFHRAKSLGMEAVELTQGSYEDNFNEVKSEPPSGIEPPEDGALWVPQGGRSPLASHGCRVLAREIAEFWEGHKPDVEVCVVVPSGTGTTAAYLSHWLHEIEAPKISVLAVPNVGSPSYLVDQMESLTRNPPRVLTPKYKFPFATPDSMILTTWKKMQSQGVYLDLIYGSPTFTNILPLLDSSEYYSTGVRSSELDGRYLMYLHTGGTEGVSSQLTRYKHIGLE